MKNNYFIILVLASSILQTKSYAQVVVSPVLTLVTEIGMPFYGVGFMDYTDDVCIQAYSASGTPFQTSFFSLNADGTDNYASEGWNFGDHQLAGIHNDGLVTYAMGANIIDGTIELVVLDNFTQTLLASYSVPVPGGYDVLESIATKYNSLPWATFPSSFTAASSVLNLTTNNEEVLVTRIGIDQLTWSFGSTQTTVEILASRAGIPKAIETDDLNNIYVWGDVERNAAGTTHDCFLLKLNPDLEQIYKRFHSSYTGRDDLSANMVMDASGNLYGVASSQNNVAPYYDHVAVFKLNKNTGKRIWLKRVGVYDSGDTGTHEARADYCGNGLAITGNTPNATNTDSRTWRIDANGNVLWNKVLNLETEAGSFETGSSLTFCTETCDVIVVGYRQCVYPVCGGLWLMRYEANTGNVVWGPENYSGFLDYFEDFIMQINYASVDNSIYVSGLGFTATDDLWHFTTMKYEQIILKQADEQLNTQELMLSPNPVYNILNIQNIKSGQLIEIMDINGKIVAEYISEENTKLDVLNLIPGMYFIRVANKGSLQTSSFIKM